MDLLRRYCPLLVAPGAMLLVGALWAAEPVDFAREVQPILAKRCFQCHGPSEAEGGLRLHERASALQELDSGEYAIVPKDAAKSALLARITAHDESERMPPEGKPLTETQIGILRRWIEEGAEYKEHWSFAPVAQVKPPQPSRAAWVANPIDAFVLARLEAAGLAPHAPADKVALIRRAYYDLTGLPPTPAEIAAFVRDEDPQAYARLIDRLLESPHYGERWARHWLDVVRYAETNSFERDGKKPHVWRYRDYVIRAFNDDKPYDQFVREQIAGDELSPVTNDGLIATGFLRLGLWDDEPADRELARFDVLDDVVATTSQAFLGLTMNCARCHDHKIDPIPQKEYYQLVSFFHGLTSNGTGGPNVERPLFSGDDERQTYEERVRERIAQRNETQAKLSALETEFQAKLAARDAAADARQPDLDDLEFRFYRDSWQALPDFDNLKAETVGKLPQGLFDLAPATRNTAIGFVFTGVLKVPADGQYTFSLDSDDGSRLTLDGKQLLELDGIHGTGKPRTATVELRAGRYPIRLDYFQNQHGWGLIVKWSGPGFTDRLLSTPASEDPARTALAPAARRDRRSAEEFARLVQREGPALIGPEKTALHAQLVARMAELKPDIAPPGMAYCATEVGPQPPETFVLARGNPHVRGEKVLPGFPAVAGGGLAEIPAPPPGAKTSGRRTVLANWIASPDNRLTARVMVNRLWQHHFGRGIVRSSNNFGLLGDAPTHPELLDWLAGQFVAGGWRMKPLHRLIMLSNTYRQSALARPEAAAKDPTNNLFWRFDPRRLSAEELRDSIYAATGKLNRTLYGPSVFTEISPEVLAGQSVPGAGWGKSSPEEQARRSIYIHVKRSLIVPLLADFDFADTDSSCPVRFATTQPGQALGMLNSKFIHEQAADFAARLRQEAPGDVEGQVRLGWRLVTGREATPESRERARALLAQLQAEHKISADKALDVYCRLLLNLNEFVYLD